MKFKIGNKVKVKRTTSPFHNLTGTVKSFNHTTSMYRIILDINNTGSNFYEESLILVENKMCKTSDRQWSFTSRHLQDIDWQEIADSVTHRHPLSLVEIGSDQYWVGVHSLLFNKASYAKGYVKESPSFTQTKRLGEVLFYRVKSVRDFAKWVEWAKSVKQSQWKPGIDLKDRKVVVNLVNL